MKTKSKPIQTSEIKLKHQKFLKLKRSADKLEMEIRSEIAQSFRAWMKKEGYTRVTAGQAIGVNPNTLTTWSRDVGEKRASIETMCKCMDRFNIPYIKGGQKL